MTVMRYKITAATHFPSSDEIAQKIHSQAVLKFLYNLNSESSSVVPDATAAPPLLQQV